MVVCLEFEMLKRTCGIVLKNAVFGEADLIVTYLTSQHGLLKTFAKSPRKIKSRFGSSLEPLTYARISFFGKEEAGLPRLTQSDIIRPFDSLRSDFNSLLDISEILELCLNFLPEREPAPDVFKLLLNMMMTLESHTACKLLYLFYKIKFLQIAGYLPGLSACGKCGAKTSMVQQARHNYHHFYLDQGTVICSRCLTGESGSMPGGRLVSSGSLRFYEGLLKWNPSAIGRINASGTLVAELADVIDEHIRYVLGPSRISRFKTGSQ